MNLIDVAERGLVPDRLIRIGIRRLLKNRLRACGQSDHSDQLSEFAQQLCDSPLALSTATANDQHYEVPADFFLNVLGPRLKYSACHFNTAQTPLGEAESIMLRMTCARAEIEDGMRVLELGCGWGSLTLWIAQNFPHCTVTAVSNSESQKEFIENRAHARCLTNVQVVTADMRDFSTDEQFDRVVSVEMFEHMRNYRLLLHRVSNWLTPEGKAFVHVFCHKSTPYLFTTEGAANWMGRHFFTGGMMPSEDLLGYFDEHLSIENQWRVSGLHYWRTCEAWLKNLDRNRSAVVKLFRRDFSTIEAKRRVQRWRIFFMACAELFRYRGGNEWFVAHYLMQNQAAQTTANQVPQLQHAG